MNNDFPVAVIMDSQQLGELYLVPTGKDGIDMERLEEAGWEVTGYLGQANQYRNFEFANDEAESEQTGAPVFPWPFFTECSRDDCDAMIAIIGDGAPEFCTKHEAESEAAA